MDAKPTPRAASAGRTAHPDVSALSAYYDHTLDADAAKSIRRHLTRCRRCTRLLLDLESFSSAASDSVPARELAEARMLARSVVQQATAERWRKTALAASLLLAIVLPVTLYYGMRAEQAMGDGELSPEINLAIVSLNPHSSLRSAEGARLSLAPNARFVTLVLNTVDVRTFSEYSLVILQQTDRKVFHLDGLLPSPLGTFNIGLPADRFKPGKYRLKLLGLSGEKRVPVEEYALEIAPSLRSR